MTINKEITLAEFMNEYLAHREAILAPSTVLADGLALRKLCDHVGRDTALCEVRPRHGDTFCSKHARLLKPSSVVNHYRHLHAAFNTAKMWEYVDENPFEGVTPPRIYKTAPKFIPSKVMGAFLDGVMDFDLRMLITGYYATGRRRCELLAIEWKDINWTTKEYKVHLTKTHQDAIFPINELFLDVLGRQAMARNGSSKVFPRWKNPDTVTHLVKQALINGGYGDLHLHNLRHSFASAFVEAGGNIYTLMKLLGHSNVNTTMIYADLTTDHLKLAIEKVGLQ